MLFVLVKTTNVAFYGKNYVFYGI